MSPETASVVITIGGIAAAWLVIFTAVRAAIRSAFRARDHERDEARR